MQGYDNWKLDNNEQEETATTTVTFSAQDDSSLDEFLDEVEKLMKQYGVVQL